MISFPNPVTAHPGENPVALALLVGDAFPDNMVVPVRGVLSDLRHDVDQGFPVVTATLTDADGGQVLVTLRPDSQGQPSHLLVEGAELIVHARVQKRPMLAANTVQAGS